MHTALYIYVPPHWQNAKKRVSLILVVLLSTGRRIRDIAGWPQIQIADTITAVTGGPLTPNIIIWSVAATSLQASAMIPLGFISETEFIGMYNAVY